MKHFLLAACMAMAAMSCNNNSKQTAAESPAKDSSNSSVAEAPITYPYDLGRPYADWEPGDKKNAVNAMKALKAFEEGDIASSVAYFGDSVTVHFDYYANKFSNDSLKHFFTDARSNYNKLTVQMNDFESVISKDKQQEYVTLWYKEIFTDKKGKTDSISIINDLQIKNGKIVMLDEKVQHFPPKK